MSESTADRAKLLEDSTESESELLQAETDPLVPSKDGPATAAVTSTLSGNDEQKQSGPWESPAQPPPYEPGQAGVMPQHGGGCMGYAGTSAYAPAHPQPPLTTPHTSVQNQTTVVQVQPYTVSHAQPALPPTYFGLALFATLCCFWPLGVVAIIKSNEVKKHYGMRNYELARQASEKARSYSRMSIIIGIILNIVSGAMFGVIVYFRVTAFKATDPYSYG